MATGYIRYDASTQSLTVPDLIVTFSDKIKLEEETIEKYDASFFSGFPDSRPEISFGYKFTAPNVIFSKLNKDSNNISFQSIDYTGDTTQEFKFDLNNFGSLQLTHKSEGATFKNISYLIPYRSNRNTESGTTRIRKFFDHWNPDSFAIGNSSTDTLEFLLFSSESKNIPLFSTTTEQKNTQMFDLEDGVLGELVLENYKENHVYQDYEQDGNSFLNQEYTTESVMYKGLDLTGWLELFFPNDRNNGRITLLEESRSKNYQSNDNGDTFSADEILVKGLSHENSNFDLIGMFLILMTSQSYNENKLAFDFFEVIRGLGLESLNIFKISSTFLLPEDDSKFEFNIDQITATNLSSSKFGEISVHGFKTQDNVSTGTISFDKFSIGNLVFPDLEPIKPYLIGTKLEDIEEGGFETARVFFPRSLQIELSNLDVNIPDVDPNESIHFKVGNFFHSFESKIPPIPTRLVLEVTDFEIPVSLIHEQDSQDFLTRSGIENLQISHNLEFKWDERTDEARIENFVIEAEKLGRLTASLQLDGIPESLIENPFKAFQVALVSVLFNKADIKFEDYGLTENVISQLSEGSGRSREETKQILIQLIQAELTEVIQNEEFNTIFEQEFSKFLENPSSFILSLSPENPVPIAQLFGSLIAPGILPDILNATVKANE